MADIAALLSERFRDNVARAGLAGCVAAALYGITTAGAWVIAGMPQVTVEHGVYAVRSSFS